MIIFKKPVQLSGYLEQQKKTGKKIGFVPTMGALHQGHLALVAAALKENDIVVCSIFVNPAQFNNSEDLKHYPVTVERDIEQLVDASCDVLLLPSVESMYPPGHTVKQYELGGIEDILEGHYRPGHFQGVCQVVDRLLQIVAPHNLYMGQKDFQQCMVIKKLLRLIGKEDEIRLVIVQTVREQDGLAMSSRNLRLNEAERSLAQNISKELAHIRENLNRQSFDQLTGKAKENLTSKGFIVDYISIVNANDLSPAKDTSGPLVALAAAAIGKIRLIDNIMVNAD